MSSEIKKCNYCKAELKVPAEAKIVECPVCMSINGYGTRITSQHDQPGKTNTGYGAQMTSQYDKLIETNTGYGAAQLTSQFGNCSMTNIGSGAQMRPHDSYQQEQSFQMAVPQHGPANSSRVETTSLSFPQLGSLRPMRTTSLYQESPQSSPRPDHNSSYFKPQVESSPQNSPRSDYSSTYFQQQDPSSLSSPRLQVQTPQEYTRPFGTKSFLRPQVKSSPPLETPRPLELSTFHPLQVQTSLPTQASTQPQTQTSTQPQGTPSPFGIHHLYRPPAPTSLPPSAQTLPPPPKQTPPSTPTQPQGSARPNYNIYQPPIQTQISPPTQTPALTSTQVSPPQGSPHLSYNLYQPPVQTPIPPQTPPSSQVSLHDPNNNSSQPPLQTHTTTHTTPPPTRTQTKPSHQASSPPQGSSIPMVIQNQYQPQPQAPTHSNNVYQPQPLQTSPHVSPPPMHTSAYYPKQPQPDTQISQPQMNTISYPPQIFQDSYPVKSTKVPSSTREDPRIQQYGGYKATVTTAFTAKSSSEKSYRFIQTATQEPVATSAYEDILYSLHKKMSEAGASTVGIREI